MRKILSFALFAFFSIGALFAQNSALRDAKRALGKEDLKEARVLIQQAASHSETATNPETWKVMGDIGIKAFDIERMKIVNGQNANDKIMYDGLIESYLPYIKADSLAQIPNEKGKVRNRVRKDISKKFQENHQFFINGGDYYYKQNDFTKAADFFEIYWNIPSLPMFADNDDAFAIDENLQTMKYYAIIMAIQAQDHKRAINLLNRAVSEVYVENDAFKESDLYELMADEYMNLGDTTKYIETLRQGVEQFPESKYFIPNLVNVFIRNGDSENAITYLDQAIKNDPSNTCDLSSVKGDLLANLGDYDASEAEYLRALEYDSNCERALENLARSYIVQAQILKDETAVLTNRQQQVENDKIVINYYQKTLPLLEKLNEILKDRKAETNSVLTLLRNVYYNLSVLGVDKSEELKNVEKELGIENE